MTQQRFALRCLQICGSVMCLLGLAHMLIAVPMGVDIVKALPDGGFLHPLTLGNVVTALSVAGAGLLTLYCRRGLRQAESWAMTIALGAGAFISLVGLGYVLSTPDNPFAYLALLVGLCDVAALGMLRAEA
jgi:hypothetical protein